MQKHVLTKRGIKEYFDYWSSAEDVEKGKPAPAVYLMAAKKLEVKAKECLVFGDYKISGFNQTSRQKIITRFITPY
ncbi:MAG: HAD family hydrolase [Bacteroidales bacterium]|nr:HAD family hydrolase [Bacteroidales bacterium]